MILNSNKLYIIIKKKKNRNILKVINIYFIFLEFQLNRYLFLIVPFLLYSMK